MALLFCLIVICKRVDSRSISELPSDLKLEDNSQSLSQQSASSNNGNDADANNHNMAKVSDKRSLKRGPCAAAVANDGVLIQKLRGPASKRNENRNRPVNDLGFMSRTNQAALDAFALLQEEREAESQDAFFDDLSICG